MLAPLTRLKRARARRPRSRTSGRTRNFPQGIGCGQSRECVGRCRLLHWRDSRTFQPPGSVAGLSVSGIISYFNYVPVTLADLLILIICGVLGGTAGLCISGASKILESSVFAPIQYVQLVAGFILGYLFFYDIPDKFEVIGSFIIVCSGLFLIYRENKLKIRPLVSKKSRTRDMFLRGH